MYAFFSYVTKGEVKQSSSDHSEWFNQRISRHFLASPFHPGHPQPIRPIWHSSVPTNYVRRRSGPPPDNAARRQQRVHCSGRLSHTAASGGGRIIITAANCDRRSAGRTGSGTTVPVPRVFRAAAGLFSDGPSAVSARGRRRTPGMWRLPHACPDGRYAVAAGPPLQPHH